MRIKEGQIFNLMDKNGRRNDVIHALQGYLTVFVKHDPYDKLMEEIKRIPDFNVVRNAGNGNLF